MEKITSKKYHSIPSNRKMGEGFISTLRDLKVGEGIFIPMEEWKVKTPPSTFLGQYRRRLGYGFTTKKASDNSGYAILRTS